jgi:diguanylate cyclase (GGDEF)-like protein/PAS domain S-box-containing protein
MTMMDELGAATLSALTEHAAHGILITDAELKICGWNHWLEIHSGRQAWEMTGRNLLEAYPDLVTRRMDRFYYQALSGEDVVLLEPIHHYLLPMGPTLPRSGLKTMLQSVRLGPLREKTRVIGTITVIEDVTQRVLDEAESHKHLAKLKETEGILRSDEAHFRSLVDNTSDLITIMDGEGTLRYVSPAVKRLLGYQADDWMGRSILRLIHPDDLRAFMKTLNELAENPGVAYTVEFRIRHQDTLWRCLEATGKNLSDTGGAPSLLMSSRDITNRKEAEQALAWQLKVNAALAEVSTALLAHLPVDSISALVLDHAKRLTGSAYGFAGYIDPQSGNLVAPTLTRDIWESCQVTDKKMIFCTFGGLWGWVLKHRKTLVTNHPADDSRSAGTPPGHLPITRFLSAPALVDEHLVGQIALANADEEYRDRDVALVERLATLYAIAIQHQYAEDELREERNFVSAILDTTGALVTVLDHDGQIVRFNRACERTTGYVFEEVKGKNLWELFLSPEELEQVQGQFEVLNNGKAGHEGENQWLTKNGERRLIAWSSSVLHDSDGMTKFVIVTGIDNTDSRKAEAALQKSKEDLTAWVNELELHNREITLLNEMTDLLQTCVNIDEAHNVVAQSLHQLFAAEAGALFSLSASRSFLEAVAVWGRGLSTQRIFAAEECWAVRRGRLHVVEKPDAGLLCRHVIQPVTSGYACVPMVAQGEALGMLFLQNSAPGGRLSESQQRMAVTVAEHIALALANLKLRETLRNQSIRDPLTGLFNRRYMEESLERELSRAVRSKRALGVIMIDIDHFKHFNDHFGHEAGDELLRALGAFLHSNIREGDIACRYGGEEFTLILPEAALNAVRQRAEQLREGFKSMQVKHQGRLLGPVTLSFGVAFFPEHGSTIDALLRKADQALYAAKAAGRDRVALAAAEEPGS